MSHYIVTSLVVSFSLLSPLLLTKLLFPVRFCRPRRSRPPQTHPNVQAQISCIFVPVLSFCKKASRSRNLPVLFCGCAQPGNTTRVEDQLQRRSRVAWAAAPRKEEVPCLLLPITDIRRSLPGRLLCLDIGWRIAAAVRPPPLGDEDPHRPPTDPPSRIWTKSGSSTN